MSKRVAIPVVRHGIGVEDMNRLWRSVLDLRTDHSGAPIEILSTFGELLRKEFEKTYPECTVEINLTATTERDESRGEEQRYDDAMEDAMLAVQEVMRAVIAADLVKNGAKQTKRRRRALSTLAACA